MDHFNRDDLDNLILTANSLPDWIRLDATLSQEQKDALGRFVVTKDCGTCKELANRQKHVKPERQYKKPVKVEWKPGGTGFAVRSKRVFGAGDEIVIEYDANHSESALHLVVRIFNCFRYIFEIAPGQGGNPKLRFLINQSITRSAAGDVEEALNKHDEAFRLKHRIKRRRR
jgi:hypothetical protein